jgi:hypothetical protein
MPGFFLEAIRYETSPELLWIASRHRKLLDIQVSQQGWEEYLQM